MPSRNTVKYYDVNAFYHVYNRGAGGQKLFLDSGDRQKFLSLIARYVTPQDERDEKDKLYPEDGEVFLNALSVLRAYIALHEAAKFDIEYMSKYFSSSMLDLARNTKSTVGGIFEFDKKPRIPTRQILRSCLKTDGRRQFNRMV